MLARSAIRPLVAFVGVALAAGITTRAAVPVAQVLEVRSRIEAQRPSVVIESSAPVSYAATQPDPLTVLVDLRHARADAAVTTLAAPAGGPVADVAFEATTASDGADVARVRVRLSEPRVARVTSLHREIIVAFEPSSSEPIDVAGAAPAAAPAPAVATVAPATALVSVVSESVDGRTRIRLRGNGRLVPRSVEDSADPPPRVVIDLPGVVSRVPSSLAVNKHGVARVRVAENSRTPLVTRVVLDLAQKVPYDVTPVGDTELVITVGEKLAAVPAPARVDAPAAAAAPVAAAPTPVAAPVAPAATAPTAPMADDANGAPVWDIVETWLRSRPTLAAPVVNSPTVIGVESDPGWSQPG